MTTPLLSRLVLLYYRCRWGLGPAAAQDYLEGRDLGDRPIHPRPQKPRLSREELDQLNRALLTGRPKRIMDMVIEGLRADATKRKAPR